MNVVLKFPKECVMKKQNVYKDDFEMLTLRHDYIRKIKDPKKVDIKPFKHLASITAEAMYEKHRSTFEKVGFDFADVESIGMVYLFIYLGAYSFKENSKAKERFLKYFQDKNSRKPSQKEMDRTERNLIINFLRQKMHGCSVICERKSRNIVGAKGKKFIFAHTKDSVPAHPEEIIQDRKKYGYRKVTLKEFLEAKEIARLNRSQELLDKDGFRIVQIQEHSVNTYLFSLIEKEFNNGTFSRSTEFLRKDYMPGFYYEDTPEYLSDPEETLIKKQEELADVKDIEDFNKIELKTRRSIIRRFIESNKDNPRLISEIKTARAILRN